MNTSINQNELELIYRNTFLKSLETQQLVPLNLDCEHLKKAIHNCFGFEESTISISNDQESIYQFNLQNIQLIIDSLNILESYLHFGWMISKCFIQRQIEYFIQNTQLNTFGIIQIQELGRTKTELINCYNKIENNIYELIETLITELVDDFMSLPLFKESLTDILDNQLSRLTYDLYEFSYLEDSLSQILLIRVFEIFLKIVNQFQNFLFSLSFFANLKMIELNNLLEKYTALANKEVYQIMQKEIALCIVQNGITIIRETCFNNFVDLEEKIVKQALKHFYYAQDSSVQQYQYTKQISFTILNSINHIEIHKPLPQNIQIFQQNQQLELLKLLGQIYVIEYKEVHRNDDMGLLITIKYQEQELQFLLYLSHHYLLFHQFYKGWIAKDQRFQINALLPQFINDEFDYLHQNYPEFERKVTSEKSSGDKSQEESLNLKQASFKFKSFKTPKKPIRYGTKMNMIGAKALGAGVGYFLVDCLDDDMEWEEKLRHAGFAAATAGMLGVLAARLPVIGLLIQQIILAIALKTILDNKVINDAQTTKNIGHLSAQISLALGMTMLGSVVFPVTFWGAFFGGVLGGVCMGIYGKYVIPNAMTNIMEMLFKSSILIRKSGIVRYREYGIRKMKIDSKFIETRKPNKFSYDDFFTLLMFCLVNEVKLVCQVTYLKELEKLIKKGKNKEMGELLKRQVEREVELREWDGLSKYLMNQKISVIENIEVCNEFVEGMLSNFKVK